MTTRYADHGTTVTYGDFEPTWLMLASNNVAAIEGSRFVTGTNVSSFVILGQVEVNSCTTTNTEETYREVVNYLWENQSVFTNLKTVDKTGDYSRIGPFPDSLRYLVRVNAKVEKKDNQWNKLWTVPLDVVTFPFQLIYILTYRGC